MASYIKEITNLFLPRKIVPLIMPSVPVTIVCILTDVTWTLYETIPAFNTLWSLILSSKRKSYQSFNETQKITLQISVLPLQYKSCHFRWKLFSEMINMVPD